MKFDKMPSLSWFVFVAILLVSFGTASDDMVSAAPVPASADEPSIRVRGQYPTSFPKGQYHTGSSKKVAPTGHSKRVFPTNTETFRIAVPIEGPFRFNPSVIGLPVEAPLIFKRQDGDIFKTVPESHPIELNEEDDEGDKIPLSRRRMINDSSIRWINPANFKRRDLLSSAATTSEEEPESDSESESVDYGLSKRRMQVNGAVRYVNPADVRKRDLPSSPSTTITTEEESEEGAALSKRRMVKSGQIQTVHPDDYMKRDLSSTTPEEEEEEDYVALSKRRMMIDRPYGGMLEAEYE
ncbi:hypothetical protein EC957_000376 [Mortierella hygrophila]|uniref:Uncharacterized protein n=1 Tax=Mortierella hygrophila TaxID=979708 RepID=A0A9P6F702_9FUNG|nr:hypothetical protein EC957_000376 [Mortierella hygrophila]